MAEELETLHFAVEAENAEERLDVYLAARLPQFSRTAIRRSIQAGEIQVDGKRAKPAFRLRGTEAIQVRMAPQDRTGPEPEKIPLDILFEDDDFAVVNKPTGMVVHPAKGHWAGTLASALAFHFQQLSTLGGAQRPGIVHRLDRDTSGVILVAKNDQAHMALAKQFEAREVEKEYFAICRGQFDRDRDWIREPIGVHPYQREKMAIRANHETSRSAETFVEVQERFAKFVAFRVYPKTGRTHQIRVHLAHVGCPVLCDPLYAGHRRITAADLSTKSSADKEDVILDRLALHARRIRIRHPSTQEQMEFEADIPPELESVMARFQAASDKV